MVNFVMLVGIPGSGKSTYSKTLQDEGYIIHSSDKIREEINGDANCQDNTSEVFETLHNRVVSDLSQGKSCVYDATNLSRRDRMNFLRKISRIKCHKKCVLFITPVDVCKSNNLSRERNVPDAVINRMLKRIQIPYYYEGWNEIEVKLFPHPDPEWELPLYLMKDFPQDNPHHEYTLDKHTYAVQEYCVKHLFSDHVIIAAGFHDFGKVFTKSFFDSRGNHTDIAHYYDHENVSAYLYLTQFCSSKRMYIADDLYIACLINWHMRPLTGWNQSKRAMGRDNRLVGDRMFYDIMALHEADVNSCKRWAIS